MTLRDVIARLDEFDDGTIFAECATPTARAVGAIEAADGSSPRSAVSLRYLLEVRLAREAIEVWRAWRLPRRQRRRTRSPCHDHCRPR
jgi:hypothetical protein